MRYLYGRSIDSLFAIFDGTNTLWYLTDMPGSVRELTNITATVIQDRLTYDGFGNILHESNAANGDRFKFTGREWDSTLGLQLNRARYYNPSDGKWVSQDPIGLSSDPNSFRYMHNRPDDSIDPTGYYDWSPFWDGLLYGGFGAGQIQKDRLDKAHKLLDGLGLNANTTNTCAGLLAAVYRITGHTYLRPFIKDNQCIQWVQKAFAALSAEMKDNQCFHIDIQICETGGPSDDPDRHAAIRITFKDGTVRYIDNGFVCRTLVFTEDKVPDDWKPVNGPYDWSKEAKTRRFHYDMVGSMPKP